MAAISFSDDRAWVKARWAVARVFADMRAICPDDPELIAALEQAIGLGGISFDLLDQQVAARLTAILKDVIAQTLSGSSLSKLTWHVGLDAQAQSQYKAALEELREMVDQ
jgi:hypothetical protein